MSQLDVLLPVKNGLPYVKDAVLSVLNQHFQDFSLLIIDDGSTDGTADELAKLAGSDARITVAQAIGKGLVDALNQGLAWSTSPFLARMDADDISLPTRFEDQLVYLHRHPNVDVVGSCVQMIDADGDALPGLTAYPTSPADLRNQLFSNQNPIAHPTVMMRSDKIKDLGGYRSAMKSAEDFDLWLRVAERSDLANLPDRLLQYRVHDHQVSEAHRLEQSFASELAFICSECRRAGKTDPAALLQGHRTFESLEVVQTVPALSDLAQRFAILKRLLEGALDEQEMMRATLRQISPFQESMRINHRLYADVAALIAGKAVRHGALGLALRALVIGSRTSIGRFYKASFKQFAAGG